MKKLLLLSSIFLLSIGFVSYKVTHALFSDTAQSQNNTFTAAEIFPGSPGSVVINEIMWMGSSGRPNDEWIELRNMTGVEMGIGQWTIENAKAASATYMLPANSKIQPNGFFLIANRPTTAANTDLNTNPDVNNAALSLANENNGNLVLKDKEGNVIDSALDGALWPAGVKGPPNWQSMERNLAPGDGLDANNWHTCTSSECNSGVFWKTVAGNNYGTPKAANSL